MVYFGPPMGALLTGISLFTFVYQYTPVHIRLNSSMELEIGIPRLRPAFWHNFGATLASQGGARSNKARFG